MTEAEPPSRASRLVGLGSVFGKSLRDSRGSVALVGGLVSLIVVVVASLMGGEFGTPEARRDIASQAEAFPVLFRGLLGEPIRVDEMGGFLSWRVMNFTAAFGGLWSLLALSGTIGGEAARGSLELLMTTPVSRRAIAAHKATAHAGGMAVAMLAVGLSTWVGANLFARLPGDEVALTDSLAHVVLVGLLALAPGALAFATAPILGRGAAAGLAAVYLVGSYIVNGYAQAVPLLESLRPFSVFAWTADHRPLAGQSDWGGVALLAAAVVAAVAIGVLAFDRRDLGRTIGFGLRPPRLHLAVAGPGTRSFFARLPTAAWWGFGLGLYVALFTGSAADLAQVIGSIPDMREYVEALFPGMDLASVSGVLQLVIFNLGTLLMALAAATLVGGWASDELERRLELVLSTPLSRLRWALASGAGVFAALAVTTILMAAGIYLGAAAVGVSATDAVLGTSVAGLYGAALAGVGLAVGGLGWPRLGAVAAGGLAIAWFLLEFLGTALRLPEPLLDVALQRHLGQPMAGVYGIGGILGAAALAIGGYLVCAVGLARRDLGS